MNLFRIIKIAALFPIGERIPTTCSDAGRKGAQVRNANARAKIHAVARQLCSETGQTVPECLR